MPLTAATTKEDMIVLQSQFSINKSNNHDPKSSTVQQPTRRLYQREATWVGKYLRLSRGSAAQKEYRMGEIQGSRTCSSSLQRLEGKAESWWHCREVGEPRRRIQVTLTPVGASGGLLLRCEEVLVQQVVSRLRQHSKGSNLRDRAYLCPLPTL